MHPPSLNQTRSGRPSPQAGQLARQPRLDNMTHADWLELMRFPPEWVEWDLIPDALAAIQSTGYRPGHEAASEHDRHGAFQWWLRRDPSHATLILLARVSWLDPDQHMAGYVRQCIARHHDCSAEIRHALDTPYTRV